MKKKLTAVALVVCMLAIMLVGASLAYFTDTAEAENTFTMGNVDIKLDEAKIIKEGDKYNKADDQDRVTENEYVAVYPGAEMPKDPTIYNIGSEAAYVRVKVTVTNGMTMLPMYAKDDTLTDTLYNDAFLAMIGGKLNDGWDITDGITASEAMEAVMNSQTDATFVITYTEALAGKVGDAIETAKPFDKIVIPADWTQDDPRFASIQQTGFKVDVIAEAIQVQGFKDVTEAFAAYDAE